MISLIFIFGVLGNITTGLIYISPVPTFWRIVKNKSTEDFESIPYISKLLNAYWWVYYGIITPNRILIATVSGFGAVAELIYIIIFLIYAPNPKMRNRTAILFGTLDVGFPAAVILVAQIFLKKKAQIDLAGILCVFFGLVAYASPLSAMKTVVLTQSVEYMPFLLSFILFINGGVWTVYAFLADDYFVGVPNGVGFILGTAQLILYGMYCKPSKKSKTKPDMESGSEHKPLIEASKDSAQEE